MLETILTSSLLIGILILLRYLFQGKLRLRLQYALWLLVAIRLLLPVSLFHSPLSILNAADVSSRAEQLSSPIYVLPMNGSSGASGSQSAAESSAAQNLPASGGDPAQDSELDAVARSTAKITLGGLLRAVWLTGAATVGLWFLVQNLRLSRILRKTRAPLSIKGCRLPVYLTRSIQSPCLFGLFRPAIYLTPDSLADEQSVRYILAHEETHCRHGDHVWSYLRCLCLAAHWFNPLVWWAALLSRRDCELACDEGTLNLLGDEHRKAYGNTLIRMISNRVSPSDLLCGATTMTSGKAGIKERITMIAKKPHMLLPTVLAALLLVGITVGCTFTGADPKTAEPEWTTLTAEELDLFNGDEFFNGEAFNLRNQFLSSLYDAPEEIDLYQLFYCGSGAEEPVTEAEQAAVVAQNGWEQAPDCACEKISRANMDAALTEAMGLTLAGTDGVGLENFTYLKDYDAYYSFHGDTNYRGTISFYAGQRAGDLIRLFYDDQFFGDGEKVVTLKQQDGGYRFLSNETLDATFFGSVAEPEGIVAESVSVPETVLTAAQQYVREGYESWCVSAGDDWAAGVTEQLAAAPAVYDNWRIEGVSLVYQYQDLTGPDWAAEGLDGQGLDVYRLDYRFHTTTPDRVVLAGGMDLDAEGWLLPTYPNSTYLIFLSDPGSTPLYLFAMMENDCQPGDALFTDDLHTRYQNALPLGVDKTLSQKEIQDIETYWAFDSDWAFTMPGANGYGDPWSVGLGQAYEFGLGIPYERFGKVSEPAQNLAAMTFTTVNTCYYDGFTAVLLSGFYGDAPDTPGLQVLLYLSTTQPDCLTPRGAHVGDSVETLKTLYPEAEAHEDASEVTPASGIMEHDTCYVYAPDGTNRSILFLTRDDVIVQIDMADGLDGSYESPAGLGVYSEST